VGGVIAPLLETRCFVIRAYTGYFPRFCGKKGYIDRTTRGDFDWIKGLTWYRQRDKVEKCFKGMKDFLGAFPLNVHFDDYQDSIGDWLNG